MQLASRSRWSSMRCWLSTPKSALGQEGSRGQRTNMNGKSETQAVVKLSAHRGSPEWTAVRRGRRKPLRCFFLGPHWGRAAPTQVSRENGGRPKCCCTQKPTKRQGLPSDLGAWTHPLLPSLPGENAPLGLPSKDP
ncbi:hypothetical protein HJG60_008973 [Phyllostomus discolor]|uniref:Uncharacterized protein n=1 Tax=Phyllostomus discolor TaxID=89673 RepID=A0A833YTS8_9CHIR|nr:hypothetical protein HJG60_008973 [Phyllostomus discolor]